MSFDRSFANEYKSLTQSLLSKSNDDEQKEEKEKKDVVMDIDTRKPLSAEEKANQDINVLLEKLKVANDGIIFLRSLGIKSHKEENKRNKQGEKILLCLIVIAVVGMMFGIICLTEDNQNAKIAGIPVLIIGAMSLLGGCGLRYYLPHFSQYKDLSLENQQILNGFLKKLDEQTGWQWQFLNPLFSFFKRKKKELKEHPRYIEYLADKEREKLFVEAGGVAPRPGDIESSIHRFFNNNLFDRQLVNNKIFPFLDGVKINRIEDQVESARLTLGSSNTK